MDDTLNTLKALFEATGFHHLLVIEGKRLVGVVSDRDLLKNLSPFVDTLSERSRDRAILERRAHQIMTREIISIQEHSSIVRAISLFNQHRISCLPVVDGSGHPVGIISWRDIMQYMEQRVTEKQQA